MLLLALPASASGTCLEIPVSILTASVGVETLENGVITYGDTLDYGNVYTYFDVPAGFSLGDYKSVSVHYNGISGDLAGKYLRFWGGNDITGTWVSDSFIEARTVAVSGGRVDMFGERIITINIPGDVSDFEDVTRYSLYVHADIANEAGDVTVYALSDIKFNAADCNNNCIVCAPVGVQTPVTQDEPATEDEPGEAAVIVPEETSITVPPLTLRGDARESRSADMGLVGFGIGVPVFGAFSGYIVTRKPKRYG